MLPLTITLAGILLDVSVLFIFSLLSYAGQTIGMGMAAAAQASVEYFGGVTLFKNNFLVFRPN